MEEQGVYTPVRRRVSIEDTQTPDSVFEAAKTYELAQQELLDFVSKQIKAMDHHLLFGGQEQPGFYQLNKSLMSYQQIQLGLIALHQEARVEKDIAQEVYDNFVSEKYCEIKIEQTNLGKQAQFTAQREIELFMRKRYIIELSKLKGDLIKKENKYNFINHLIQSWDKYAFILNTLSKNAQAEANASGIAYRNPLEFNDD